MVQHNDGKHLVNIIERSGCKKHNALPGLPCFHVPKASGFGYYAAICNKRAVLAGVNGKVSEPSYMVKKRKNAQAS